MMTSFRYDNVIKKLMQILENQDEQKNCDVQNFSFVTYSSNELRRES